MPMGNALPPARVARSEDQAAELAKQLQNPVSLISISKMMWRMCLLSPLPADRSVFQPNAPHFEG